MSGPDATRKGDRRDPETAEPFFTKPASPGQGLCADNRRLGSRFPLVAKIERLGTMLPPSVHWPAVWVAAFLLIYFFLMDCRLYQAMQEWTGPSPHANVTHYSPFRPVTMKLLMMNHMNHYIMMPVAEYFDEYSLFSKRFPFITANMVSFTHIIVCLISFRMLYSDSLLVRRLGCLVFQLRNWLDAFDGVVHRSHANSRFRLKSYRNTSGFLVDAVADTWSGFMESLSMYIFFLKNQPSGGQIKCGLLPWTKPAENGRSKKEYSKWELFRPCLMYGLLVGVSGIFWDRYIGHFNALLEVTPKNMIRKTQQLIEMKSFRMWMFSWIWRVINAQALLDMGLVAIAFDKTWPFLHVMLYFGWPCMAIVCMATEIQLGEVTSAIMGGT